MSKSPLALLVLILGLSCSKPRVEPEHFGCFDITNPNCFNYDSCLTKDSLTADFTISQVGGWDTAFEIWTNLAFNGGYYLFKAKEENAQYKWTLGAETIETRSFVRHFNLVPPGTDLEATLEVTKAPDYACYSNDDGFDRKTRHFRMPESFCEYAIYGLYNVKISESRAGVPVPEDSVLVRLEAFQGPTAPFPCMDLRVWLYEANDSIELFSVTNREYYWDVGPMYTSDLLIIIEHGLRTESQLEHHGFVELHKPSNRLSFTAPLKHDQFIRFEGRKIR